MITARRFGILALALVSVAGCAKKKSGDPAVTCERFGDAAGRCTVGAIEGKAFLAEASDHAGIRVSLVGTDRETVTADDGSFSLEKIPPGDYVVAMEADGWVRVNAKAKVQSERATVLETFTLVRATIATSVGGRFLLGGREDHAGTLVSLDGTGVAVFTAADGSFAFTKVPFGAVRITARHPGFVPLTIDLEVDRVVVDVVNRTLAPLPLPGSVSGVVRAAGEPLEGVVVALAGTEFSARTGTDGTFTIESVEAGNHVLVAVAAGFLPVSRSVTVEEGRDTAVPAIDLEPAHDRGTLQGVARRAGELRRDGIEVLLHAGDRLLGTATTDETGTYRLPEAPVGIHSLVFRAEGFPDLRIPTVALGPGDWSGPEVAMRRSVFVDSRYGRGTTTPSGRKAIISYYSGRFGTHLWDGDALTQRRVLTVNAVLVALDQEETFATLLVEDEGPSNLVRLDLATGATTLVSPAPGRLVGSVGASTFYFDEDGALHRLLAGDAVATRIDVDAEVAWIDRSGPGLTWIGYIGSDGSDARSMAFDPEGDWHSPGFADWFGPNYERFFGVTPAPDRSVVWVDAQAHVVTPSPSTTVFDVEETAEGVLVLENFDNVASSFDVRFGRFADGAVSDIAQGAVGVETLGEHSFMIVMADGSYRWLSFDDAANPISAAICAGGEIGRSAAVLMCHESGTGAVRVADDSGVRTLTSSAEFAGFLFDDSTLVWTEPGSPDTLRFASVGTLQEVVVPCAVASYVGGGGGGRILVRCSGDLQVVDVEAVAVTSLGALDPIECDQKADPSGLVCLLDDPCGTGDWCVRAFDIRTGQTAELGVDVQMEDRLRGYGTWSAAGGAVAYMAEEEVLQVVFPASGEPAITRCLLPETGSIREVAENGSALVTTSVGHYWCGFSEGAAERVSDPGTGMFMGIGGTGWAFLAGNSIVNVSAGTSVPSRGNGGDWWIPPGGGDVFLADLDGLRHLGADGSASTLASVAEPLSGFGRVPLFFDGSAVRLVEADGTLVHVADGDGVTSGALGDDHSFFVVWSDAGGGDTFRVSLQAGAIERMVQGIDVSLLYANMNDRLYVNGVVDGVGGLYRISPDGGPPVHLLERAEHGMYDGGWVWLFDGESTWLDHGGALLVHDAPLDSFALSRSWERGLVFNPGEEDAVGTWWFALP